MNIASIRVKFASRRGLANYSHMEAELDIAADLEDGEDAEEAIRVLFAQVRAKVLEQLDTRKPKPDKTPQDPDGTSFAVLPADPQEAIAAADFKIPLPEAFRD